MCGIAGIFDTRGLRPIDRSLLERMNQALRHEEPDRVPISDFFWGGFKPAADMPLGNHQALARRDRIGIADQHRQIVLFYDSGGRQTTPCHLMEDSLILLLHSWIY